MVVLKIIGNTTWQQRQSCASCGKRLARIFFFLGFLGFKDDTYRTDDEVDEEEDKEKD